MGETCWGRRALVRYGGGVSLRCTPELTLTVRGLHILKSIVTKSQGIHMSLQAIIGICKSDHISHRISSSVKQGTRQSGPERAVRPQPKSVPQTS